MRLAEELPPPRQRRRHLPFPFSGREKTLWCVRFHERERCSPGRPRRSVQGGITIFRHAACLGMQGGGGDSGPAGQPKVPAEGSSCQGYKANLLPLSQVLSPAAEHILVLRPSSLPKNNRLLQINITRRSSSYAKFILLISCNHNASLFCQ